MEEKFNNVKCISHPSNINVNLYKHQLTSIWNLEHREEKKQLTFNNSIIKTNIGIFADMTGFGKSLSMITLILRNKMEWDLDTAFSYKRVISYSNGLYTKTETTDYIKSNSTIILTNQSIISQWEDEIKKVPSLKYIKVINKKNVEDIDIDQYDIILLSPSIYNSFITIYNRAWKRFIFDEPNTVKIPKMKQIVAGFYWFITATPTLLYKNCQLKFNMMTDMFENLYNSNEYTNLIVKNDDDYIKYSYDMPVVFNYH